MMTKNQLLSFKNQQIHLITTSGFHYNGKISLVGDGFIILKDKFNEEVTISLDAIGVIKLPSREYRGGF